MDDVSLRRIERDAVLICLGMAAIGLVLAGGRPGPAAGVLGGGLLIGFGYWTLKGGVTALTGTLGRPGGGRARPPKPSRVLLGVAGRYALLAFLAYVMIARLRLHPMGLLAGASSVVAAVAVEAVRLLSKKP